MQREIANVAAHCALQGFRYMAFPPLSFEPAPRPQSAALQSAALPVEALPSIAVQDPVAEPLPQAAAAHPRRSIALLDDVAPRAASVAPRPMRDSKALRPQQEHETDQKRRRAAMRPALSAAPPRAERVPTPARAEREASSARAERATRYALLRDLSDDKR